MAASDIPRHRPRKRFGQHFLKDRDVLERIIDAVRPRPGQLLVEIGPGQGVLTERLLQSAGQLHVIEVDRDLAGRLQHRFSGTGLVVHTTDALKFDFSQLAGDGDKLRIIGNLPYNISTPLLFHLLQSTEHIQDMVFMLQEEVVQRLAAGTGEAGYGRLSLMVQYHCQVTHLFRVPSSAFTPRPKVESAVAHLMPHCPRPYAARDPETLFTVVRTAFSARRKTLRNSLKSLISPEHLSDLGIDHSLRPENLSLAEYVRISDALQD